MSRLDIIVFGATGFTGKFVVIETAKLSKVYGNLSWGIAGRNKEKLTDRLSEVGRKLNEDLSNVQVLVADVINEDSIKEMTSKAKVIVNCVGPYSYYGEIVVKACIASGTHHVDISGEPYFMESMQLKYHFEAQEKGSYIVSACGMDSIPADLGCVFLANKFKGEINSIETYMKLSSKFSFGAQVHYGTWESVINGFVNSDKLKPLRKQLFPQSLPELEPRIERKVFHKVPFSNGWCFPFPGSDRSVMQRSQRFFYEKCNKRPAQVNAYIIFHPLIAIFAFFMGLFFVILSKFSMGRNLLLSYPRLFTFGLVGHNVSEETVAKSFMTLYLHGKGWTETLSEVSDKHVSPPNKEMLVKFSCQDPGYGRTSTALVLSAITILKEADKMPSTGGVYPPAAAFATTSLIEELNKNEMKFEILKQNDLGN